MLPAEGGTVKRTVFLIGHQQRRTAHEYIDAAEPGDVMTIKPPTRNLEQNARMWAMLGDVSKQVDWYGKKLSSDAWKCVFSASLKKQDVVPGLHGDFVVIGQSTSQMSVRDMSDLIELMFAFGAEHQVQWGDPAAHKPKQLEVETS